MNSPSFPVPPSLDGGNSQIPEAFSVLSILPFWRYALCPTSMCSPGLPYYRLATALMVFEQFKRELPFAGCFLIRRRLFRGIEVIRHYVPEDGR